MPEGDTIHRLAAKLAGVIGGAEVRSLELPRLAHDTRSFSGVRVKEVEARGKHLCVHFDNDRVLVVHLGMLGRVYVKDARDPWRGRARVVVVLRSEAHEVVCVHAPSVRLIDEARLRFDRRLDQLGPDVLGEPFDVEDGVRRLTSRGPMSLGVVLLDQRLVAGFGNVWKSELCFLERLDPRAQVTGLDPSRLAALLGRGRQLMTANVAKGGMRVTREGPDGPLCVYGRAGEMCLECRTVIESFHQGEPPRLTYWCPRCQRSVDR